MQYQFAAKLWLYPGEGAWHFITLPQDISDEIKMITSEIKRGFGSVKVEVTIGKSTWQTSIFPDSKSSSYILPVKKDVRTTNNLQEDHLVEVKLEIIQV